MRDTTQGQGEVVGPRGQVRVHCGGESRGHGEADTQGLGTETVSRRSSMSVSLRLDTGREDWIGMRDARNVSNG